MMRIKMKMNLKGHCGGLKIRRDIFLFTYTADEEEIGAHLYTKAEEEKQADRPRTT